MTAVDRVRANENMVFPDVAIRAKFKCPDNSATSFSTNPLCSAVDARWNTASLRLSVIRKPAQRALAGSTGYGTQSNQRWILKIVAKNTMEQTRSLLC